MLSSIEDVKHFVQTITMFDGEFELEHRDITLNYRGSPNQRIINVKESIKNNEIIEEQY